VEDVSLHQSDFEWDDVITRGELMLDTSAGLASESGFVRNVI